MVYVTGTFTNWRNHILMNRIINEFHLVLVYFFEKRQTKLFIFLFQSLSPGIYEYKYIVDGVWKCSNHEQTTSDGHGNVNNIVDTGSVERQKNLMNHFNQGSGINTNGVGHANDNTYMVINYEHQRESGSMNNNSPEKNPTMNNAGYNVNKVKNADLKFLTTAGDSSNLKINEANFENSENNFMEEAPEIPSHLMCIPFLAVCIIFLKFWVFKLRSIFFFLLVLRFFHFYRIKMTKLKEFGNRIKNPWKSKRVILPKVIKFDI